MQRHDTPRGRAILLVSVAVVTAACGAPAHGPPPPGTDTAGVVTADRDSPAPPADPPAYSPTATAPPVEGRGATGTGTCASGAPLIKHASWIEVEGRPSLEVSPTDLLRACGLAGVDDQAWAEVLDRHPDAATPGMAEQFTCHVLFAAGKREWHLEPWRPVVDGTEMIRARCNPGAPDPDLG